MPDVGEVLRSKQRSTVEIVKPDDSVFEAIRLMASKNVGALLVMEDDHIVGIITERDYARKVILKDRSSKETRVSEIMSDKVLYVTPEDTADSCMALMTERRIRHLPVIDNGDLIGLISTGDIVKTIVSDRNFLVEQLTRYITGSHKVDSKRLYGIEDSPAPERIIES